MATEPTHPLHDQDGPTDKYSNCIVQPMTKTEDGEPTIRLRHVIDAALVAGIVFFAVILGDLLPTLLGGQNGYLTVREIMARLPTAGIAFGLTFAAQFARARGIELLAFARRLLGE